MIKNNKICFIYIVVFLANLENLEGVIRLLLLLLLFVKIPLKLLLYLFE